MSTSQFEFERMNLADSRNFGLLYDHFAPMLWRHILLRTRSKDDADEILSKVFLKTWEYVSSRRRVKNIRGFLWAVTNRLIVDFYRSNARLRSTYVDFNALYEEGREPVVMPAIEEELSAKMDVREIIAALELLRYDDRLLLTLRFIEELPLEEVAATWGRSKNATAVAIHRALKRLRQVLRTNSNLNINTFKSA
jgi:RNA polymerase sigma-70 factor (ECF subfamily)